MNPQSKPSITAMIHHPSKLLRLAAFLSLVSVPALSAAEGGFNKKLSLQGITFHVTCPNEGSINHLRIVAKGLTNDAEPIKVKATPISPPSGPMHWLFQGPPAENK